MKPGRPKSVPCRTVLVRLPRDVYRAATEAATKDKRTLAAWVRVMVEQHVEAKA